MCGRVIAELKRQGVLEQTLVIFTGDNGYFHAEHGWPTNGVRTRKTTSWVCLRMPPCSPKCAGAAAS